MKDKFENIVLFFVIAIIVSISFVVLELLDLKDVLKQGVKKCWLK